MLFRSDAEQQSGENAYTATELVGDLQGGIFSDLRGDNPKVDPLRRHLQRAYVDILSREFNPPADAPVAIPVGPPSRRGGFTPPARTSELRGVARVALEGLAKEIASALPKAKDPATVAHLKDMLAEISQALEGKKN